MRVRYDSVQKISLIRRFNSLLGNDFLSELEGFISESDVPLGVELEILWQGVRVVAVLFAADYLLILKIQKKKVDTPFSGIRVGECKKYPAEKNRPIPLRRK